MGVPSKEQIIIALREKISKQQWEHWFADFGVLKIEGNHVVFEVANLFIKGYIEKKFDKLIKRALFETLGSGATYEIVYADFSGQHTPCEVTESRALVRKKPVLITPLNPRYTFSNFVVDEFNQFAYNLLLEASKRPGTYNPIFIYSEAGMGKTHLVQAYGNHLLTENPDIRYAYLTSEQFMNELVNKIKNGTVEDFRERYRTKVDVLVIDDVQFLSGKKGVQVELFHTFNALYEAGKQIIVCSDRAPKDLRDFQDRVISRFQMGVVAQIKSPSKDALRKIALKILEEERAEIPEDVVNFVTQHLKGSIRVLKGAMIRLIAHKSMNGSIDKATAKVVLRDVLELNPVNPETEVFSVVARTFEVSVEDLMSQKKDKRTSLARGVCMYLLHRRCGMSVRKIAETFGRTHPAVVNGIKNVEELASVDETFRRLLRKAEAQLDDDVQIGHL